MQGSLLLPDTGADRHKEMLLGKERGTSAGYLWVEKLLPLLTRRDEGYALTTQPFHQPFHHSAFPAAASPQAQASPPLGSSAKPQASAAPLRNASSEGAMGGKSEQGL